MNFDFDRTNILDTLCSHPWDSGTGKKMLFLRSRYYVFDEDHQLLDAGGIRYNETLNKIFIRNEDLRGEVFVHIRKNKKIHLKGSVTSKMAGLINIDNTLSRYNKKLQAPISRVAKVEKHLTTNDIFKILNTQVHIDKLYLKNYKNNLFSFSPEQANTLYIKLSQDYFKSYNREILEHIALYFSRFTITTKLYEELFMFIISFQIANENNYIKQADQNYFITTIYKRLLNAYRYCPRSISSTMINECLLYYKISSPHTPTPTQCVKNLYESDLSIQKEYAYYLVLMQDKVKEVEEEIFQRLMAYYQEDFFPFLEKFMPINLKEDRPKLNTQFGILLALIEALGNCQSSSKKVHIFFIFLLLSQEGSIRAFAKRAIKKCKQEIKLTFEGLEGIERSLKVELIQKLEDSFRD